MALTNKLKVQVDLPVWEWMRFNPIGNTAAACVLTTSDSLSDRYLYYLTTTTFFRYDTQSDSWQQLATPPTASLTVASSKYESFSGNHGRVLAAATGSVTLPALGQHTYSGLTLRIYAGTGAGQDRIIGTPGDPIIGDQGIVTTVTTTTVTDTTKKWNFNQWQGYFVHVEYNNQGAVGAVQYRKVLYNDATNLYLSDTNYQGIDVFNNTGFSNTAPYTTPVATAGAQAMYSITSQVCPVTVNWTTTPDTTSRYIMMGGGFYFVSSAAGSPFYTFQFYDVLLDTWFTKTTPSGLLTAALGTDVTLERTSEAGGLFLSSTATAGAARTLTDSVQAMVADRYCNFQIRITGGTACGQRRLVIANGATYFEVERAWDVTPDNTSTYAIYGNTDNQYIFGNAAASGYQYSVVNDIAFQGKLYEYGLARVMAIRLGSSTTTSYEAIAVTTAVKNTTGVQTAAINAGGTNYLIGDILTLSTGTGAKVIVTAVTAGVITAVSLIAAGTGYSVASFATTGGTGTSATITVSAVNTFGYITTAINHFYKIGDSITFTGAVEGTWNSTFTIVGVDSITTLTILINPTATAVAANALSTSVLVDSVKNWTSGEHVGKLLTTYTVGATGAALVRRITANTATTITMQTVLGAAPLNGTGRYTINDISMIGKDRQYKQTGLTNQGYATSGSATTLVDSTKTWTSYPPSINGQWTGYHVRIVAGTGFGNEVAITSNTATTLTYASQSFTPDTTTKYIIMDTYGLVTGNVLTTTLGDTTKLWTVNQWAGKRVRITAGTGQAQEALISSNTSTVLTFAAVTTAPIASDSCYTILGLAARSTGISAQWLSGSSDTLNKGCYIVLPRGGGFSVFDKYDIRTETWEYGFMMQPQSETLTTGSMYTYDGTDNIYFTNNATGRMFVLSTLTMRVQASAMMPYGMGAAVLSNRMEVIITADGLKYVYVMRHSGTEMWRTLVFW